MRTMPMSHPQLERLARHLGGPRVLALPLLRALAVFAGFVWVVLAPPRYAEWGGVHTVLLTFFCYSVALIAALWRWPHVLLRFNLGVLLVDLTFALLLVWFTGGPDSALFLALLLIVGLQSYYYGLKRGLTVGIGSGAAYVLIVWPMIERTDAANMAIQLVVLLGTALGVGLIGRAEESERLRVLALSTEAQDRERYIRGVVESLHEGVVALDAEGRISAWNRAMEERCGLPASEVVGRGLFECVPSYGREALAEPLGRLLRGETAEFTLEAMEHETGRGERVVQNLKGSLLRETGRPAGAVLLVEDITSRVALERSARQAEKLAALGTLAAGLAHELNNPIGIISSRIEIMLLEAESQSLPPGVADDLRVLHRHAQRVGKIAQGLLSFARQSPGQRGAVDLNDLVRETLLLVEKQLTRDRIGVKCALAPWLPAVGGDANALQQVVLNLVTNARDVLGAGGEITIETAPVLDGSGAARLTVRDTGPGIAPETLPRIFDPFFTTKAEGTGLGLSISYGIVRDHQGTIDVQSRPGEGTTFVLTFPALTDGAGA
jgi:PAS domain S-box-containing protein